MNTVDPKVITYIVMAAVVSLAVYRRIRRSIGRQVIHEGRLWVRIALFGVIGALILLGSLRNPTAIGALLGGLVCGCVLGLVGLRHTRFEFTPQGRFYTPHTYLGIAVILLFVGRLAYRFISMASYGAQNLGSSPDPFANLQRSPLTLAIFGVLISYYLVYSFGVLQKARAANTANAVAPPTS
jgi:hypothetical protein